MKLEKIFYVTAIVSCLYLLSSCVEQRAHSVQTTFKEPINVIKYLPTSVAVDYLNTKSKNPLLKNANRIICRFDNNGVSGVSYDGKTTWVEKIPFSDMVFLISEGSRELYGDSRFMAEISSQQGDPVCLILSITRKDLDKVNTALLSLGAVRRMD